MADTIINGNEYKYFQNPNGSNGPFYQTFFKTEDERNEAMADLTSLGKDKGVTIRYIGATEEEGLYTITPRATMGGYPLFIRAVSVNELKEKNLTGGGIRRRTRRRRSTKRTGRRKSSKKRKSKRRKSSTKRRRR